RSARVAHRPALVGGRGAGGPLPGRGLRLVLRGREPERLAGVVLERGLRQSRGGPPPLHEARPEGAPEPEGPTGHPVAPFTTPTDYRVSALESRPHSLERGLDRC